jgi:UDP-N-acetylglucosamine--N-acetylmuramyl-(pentapeptide) pyrophosphoryl-undecaprenol N-acetylglucosamine transferase
MRNSPKIVISGGGTGGHIYPAVAIANELKVQFPESEILFVGALGKMEMEKVPRAGYRIIGLPIAGINRSNMLANLTFPFKLLKSLSMARSTLKEFKPDLAIGVGGYASGPTLLTAGWMGIKTFIQEQNSYAGVTNKWLAKKASKICVAYPGMEAFFPGDKIVFTGNPVRSDIVNSGISREEALKHFGLNPSKRTVLVIGGSQGARSINRAVLAAYHKLFEHDIQLIWQTGKAFLETAQSQISGKDFSMGYVSDFIYEMDKAYAAADVVVSRAGALSVSEICLVAKPAILVPFPNAAEDHQTKNAMSLVNEGAAILVKDSEVEQRLIAECITLMKDGVLQQKLSEAIRLLARPHAARDIVEEIKKVIES